MSKSHRFASILLILIIPNLLFSQSSVDTTSLKKEAFNQMNYDETMKNVSEEIAKNKFQEAINLLNELEKGYPNNIDLLSRRAALYYWSHAYDASINEYQKLYDLTQDTLYLDEIQKVTGAKMAPKYLEKQNFMSLQRDQYSYDGKQPIERDTTLQVGLKNSDVTWIASAASIDRYNMIDRQFGLESYFSLGKKERRSAYLACYASPSPDFLPKIDLSGAIYQGILESSEISFGYRHMMFNNKDVDILKPGISFPLYSNSYRLSEELYLVPDTDSYTSVTTLSYDPSYKIHTFYRFTYGNSAETFRDESDIRRIEGFSNALGGVWRFDPSWAIGGEAVNEYRSQLYRRTGGKLYLKYLW